MKIIIQKIIIFSLTLILFYSLDCKADSCLWIKSSENISSPIALITDCSGKYFALFKYYNSIYDIEKEQEIFRYNGNKITFINQNIYSLEKVYTEYFSGQNQPDYYLSLYKYDITNNKEYNWILPINSNISSNNYWFSISTDEKNAIIKGPDSLFLFSLIDNQLIKSSVNNILINNETIRISKLQFINKY